MGAAEYLSIARGRSTGSAAASTGIRGDRGAGVVGPALRFTLNAPPFGLRRATRRAGPTTKKRTKTKSKKGTLLTR